jgi:hypothetical protein
VLTYIEKRQRFQILFDRIFSPSLPFFDYWVKEICAGALSENNGDDWVLTPEFMIVANEVLDAK